MNGYTFYLGEKIEVQNIDIKLNNLLKWGFIPVNEELFYSNVNNYDNVSNFRNWELDGSFVSDYCPYQGDEMKNTKHEFTLKADIVNDSIQLYAWYDEVWAEYAITEAKTKHYNNFSFTTPLFDKLRVESEIKKIKDSRLVRFEKDNPKGVVYLLKGLEYTKIGISIRPLDRQKNIGTKLPFNTQVIRHYVLDKKYLKTFERGLHSFFKSKRTNGEWFKLCDDDILFIDFLVSTRRMPKKSFEYQQNDKFLSYKKLINGLREIKEHAISEHKEYIRQNCQ